jgi:hypothetical protein
MYTVAEMLQSGFSVAKEEKDAAEKVVAAAGRA